MLFREQEQMLKRSPFFKLPNQASPSPIDRQSKGSPIAHSTDLTIKPNASISKSPIDNDKRSEDTVQDLTMPLNEEDVPDDDDEVITAAKIPLDEILGKRTTNFFKDTFRYNPLNSCNETTSSVSRNFLIFFPFILIQLNCDYVIRYQ